MAPFLTRDLGIVPIGAYIDPPQPRERAIITHGHADHARSGHGAVLATPETIAIMQTRYGADCAGRFEALPYGEVVEVDGVRISLHPAGHILGSAQVRLEYRGEVAVVTDATTPRQRVLVARLDTCAAEVAAAAMKAPAIVAIGSIVGLRAALAPFAIGPDAVEPGSGA